MIRQTDTEKTTQRHIRPAAGWHWHYDCLGRYLSTAARVGTRPMPAAEPPTP
jgi:hypothetical protein